MPVTKRRPSVVPDTIKSEGNESIDTFIRQAIGKETLLSFSRTGDSTVQWIQLCHALDQQDLPGWPLLTPLKVPTQKCEKCSQKFCSPINYRRHTRVHRRSLNANKESYTNRDLLGAFWDKLSLDEAKEIVSFKDVNLEEVSGPSIVTALTSFICKPGFCVFPQVYVRAGSILLDIIQCRPSSLPVSSEELFSILDAASEGTFLCAGTAESIKKYVFDGDAAKIGLEMRNLVACTSFLIEQKLVKAWVADKDAEALRCQKLLVEEEEAAQRRQAALLERKRQKKLRQKEQKAKEQTDGRKEELEVTFDASGSPLSEEVASPLATPESDLCTSFIPSDDIQILVESVQFSNREDEETEAQLGFSEHVDSTNSEWVKNQIVEGNNRQHVASAQWQVAKTHRDDGPNGFCTNQNLQVMKCGPVQKHAAVKDPRAATVVNIGKVWTRKSPTENDGKVLENIIRDTISQSDKNNCKVMIGSICVPVRNRTAPQQDDVLADAQENFSAVQGSQKMNSVQLRQVNADSVQCGDNRSIFKLWRPVNKDETSVNLPVQSGGHELEVDVKLDEVNDRTVNSENCQQSCSMKNHDRVDRSYLTLEEHGQPENLLFSSNAAKAFLARRWKDVISADHVRLVLSAELEPLGSPGAKVECQLEGPRSDCQGHTNGNADNQPATIELFKFKITKNTKTNSRVQFEKGVKVYS